MDKKNQDLRVKRTLRSIREAFYELIQEKDFESISITELTERADINRKTFYLHYSSIMDLATEVEEEILEDLTSQFNSIKDPYDITECIRIFYHFLEDGNPVRKTLLCKPEYKFFYAKLTQDLLVTDFFKQFTQGTEYPSLVRAFCVCISSIYTTWIKHDRPIPLDDLINYVGNLLLNGYNGVVRPQN